MRQFNFEWISFWIGFISGIVTWLIISGLRIIIPRLTKIAKNWQQSSRKGIETSVDDRIRNDILHRVQRLHMAAPLFALDEILVAPRLLAPPLSLQSSDIKAVTEPEENRLQFPHMPDCPELAVTNHAPLLSFPEALKGGASLLLLGKPGSGKTVALSYLASRIIQRDKEFQALTKYLPIYIHANDIIFPTKTPYEPLNVLTEALSEYITSIGLPRFVSTIRNEFERNTILLLFDGLDELPPERVDVMAEFLRGLLSKYPGTRMVVASSFDYWDGLSGMGLAPIGLASWNEHQKISFLNQWSEMWKRHVARDVQSGPEEVDPLLLNQWILGNEMNSLPLEFTLKTWAAYAGDVLGANPSDAIEAYILRMMGNLSKGRASLAKMAAQMVANLSLAITSREASRWVQELQQTLLKETTSTPSATGDEQIQQPTTQSTSPSEPVSVSSDINKPDIQAPTEGGLSIGRVLPDLIDNGLLVQYKNSRIAFIHPVITCYLASFFLIKPESINRLDMQPAWIGKNLTFQYLAIRCDLTSIVSSILDETNDPIFRRLIQAGSWLGNAPKNSQWRSSVMKHLALNLQKETLSLGLRGRLVTSLCLTRDPGVSTLFRQLLINNFSNLRLIGVWGCGFMHDVKSTQDLIGLLDDPSLAVGQAALHSLANIATKECLEAIASILLGGSEPMRRTAAEVLAYLPEEGHPALKDGSTMDDLLVRRAVVFGLVQINQPWSVKMLEQMEIEDGQWVVRSAATQALEELRNPNPRIPKPLMNLTETPWLIEFAAKLGIGVTRGRGAVNLVIQALKSEDLHYRKLAMDYFKRRGDISAIPPIYQILYGDQGEFREIAFETIWHMAGSGLQLPPPAQFGFG